MLRVLTPKQKSELYLASSLCDAIEDNNLSQAKTLLENKNANPNTLIPTKGIAPFHLAVGCKFLDFATEMTKLFLQYGGDPNVKSTEGITPMHITAAHGRHEIMKILLANGGDPLKDDDEGRTPYHYAFENKHFDVIATFGSFLEQKVDIREDSVNYKFTLDRIYIDTGEVVAEYAPSENSTALNYETANDNSNCTQSDGVFGRSLFSEVAKRHSSSSEFWSIDRDHRPSSIWDVLLQYTDEINSSQVSLNSNKLLNYSLQTPVLCNMSGSSSYKNLGIKHNKIISDQPYLSDTLISSYKSIETQYKYEDPEEHIILRERQHCHISGFVPSPPPSEMDKRLPDSDLNATQTTTSSRSTVPDKMMFIDRFTLRKRLLELGERPGPITNTTYELYLKRLHKLECKKDKENNNELSIELGNLSLEENRLAFANLSPTLLSLNSLKDVAAFQSMEERAFSEFTRPDQSRRWREGTSKTSFNYLLLDPRITKDLPRQYVTSSQEDCWKTFLASIFYVGKGKRSRPYAHLYDAFNSWVARDSSTSIRNKKLKTILDIWDSGSGVICLHVFLNTIPVEAYTREAMMIDTIGTEKLGNAKRGEFYGVASTWNMSMKQKLGKYLLYKAFQILMFEGERQLFPEQL